MQLNEWNEDFAVQIEVIDDQHKKLVGILNRLGDAMSEGKGRTVLGDVLADLADYTAYHFQTEESLLQQYAYPELERHKALHDEMTVKAKELRDDFEAGNWMLIIDTLKFLGAWLKEHILGEDRKYAPFLKDKGVK